MGNGKFLHVPHLHKMRYVSYYYTGVRGHDMLILTRV